MGTEERRMLVLPRYCLSSLCLKGRRKRVTLSAFNLAQATKGTLPDLPLDGWAVVGCGGVRQPADFGPSGVDIASDDSTLPTVPCCSHVPYVSSLPWGSSHSHHSEDASGVSRYGHRGFEWVDPLASCI